MRLSKHLKRSRARLTINKFINDSLRIKHLDFIKRDNSALQIQKLIRSFLTRWRSHKDFKTAINLWGLEVLHDYLGNPVSKDTKRAMKDGSLLANAIWCRYPCPNPGIIFHSARMENKKKRTKKKKRKIAWEDKEFMEKSSTKNTIFQESIPRKTPQSIGRIIKKDRNEILLPTYMNSTIPTYMLSRAMKIPVTFSPSHTLKRPSTTTAAATTTTRNEKDKIVRFKVPKIHIPIQREIRSIQLAWSSEAAKSLQLDVNAILKTRKNEWINRHGNHKVKHKKNQIKYQKKRLDEARNNFLLEQQEKEKRNRFHTNRK